MQDDGDRQGKKALVERAVEVHKRIIILDRLLLLSQLDKTDLDRVYEWLEKILPGGLDAAAPQNDVEAAIDEPQTAIHFYFCVSKQGFITA